MVVYKILEFSGKTGKGKMADSKGNEISFSYKQLKGQKKIEPGKKAVFIGSIITPATKMQAARFNGSNAFEKVRNLWR